MSAGTNNAVTVVKFTRTYTKYNPAPQQGPATQILATVLIP